MTRIATPAKSLDELYALWAQFGDIPTVPDGERADTLDAPFLHFETGTPREDVWRWFEAQHPAFIVGDVMQGLRATAAQG